MQNIFVALLVAPRLRALKDCHTLGNVMCQKYNKTCQILAGIISVGLCALFASVMIKAGGSILTGVFNLPLWSAMILVGGITTLYTTFGGLRASVVTDAFQFAIFAILLPIIFFWILLFHSDAKPSLFAQQAVQMTANGWTSLGPWEIVGLITAFLLGETLIPPYANRALASKSTSVSRNGFMLAGLFSMIWFVVMLSLGLLASLKPEVSTQIAGLPVDDREDAVLLTLVQTTLPPGFYALLLVVLLSVIMSSLDSLLNAGAVSLTEDIFKPFIPISDEKALTLGRSATVLIAIAAAGGALMVPSIIEGLLRCYSIWAPAILPALMLGLWIKQPRPWAGILSMLAGSLSAVLLLVFNAKAPDKIPELTKIPVILPALLIAVIMYGLGHIVSRPTHVRKR